MVSVPPRKRQSTFAFSSAKKNDFVLFNKEKQNQRKVRPSAPQAYQCKVTHSIGTATQMQLEVILAGNRIAISLSHPLLVKQRQLKSQ